MKMEKWCKIRRALSKKYTFRKKEKTPTKNQKHFSNFTRSQTTLQTKTRTDKHYDIKQQTTNTKYTKVQNT